MKALVLQEDSAVSKGNQGLHPVRYISVTTPKLRKGEVLVKMTAVALNKRDEWIRRGRYWDIKFDSVVGADGVGVVTESYDGEHDELLNQRVVICPSVGWEKDPREPEGEFGILGMLPYIGTFAEYIAVPSFAVFPAPKHLSDEEAAALPLAGLTAYRALFTKAEVQEKHRVLVTGIGGGVALEALRFCNAVGAECYVTSSSPDKLQRAIELGARAGVNYKDDDWIDQLKKKVSGPIHAIIDGAGGRYFDELSEILTSGARIVSYGTTASPEVVATMSTILKNIEFRGSTMGSRREFKEMLEFVASKKVPVDVYHVVQGLDKSEEAYKIMREREQFGKLVIRVIPPSQ